MVLWLPPERQAVRGGPPRVSNRAALAGIAFVLRRGLRWRDLPLELGYGSGGTCWRRRRPWQGAGRLGRGGPRPAGLAGGSREDPLDAREPGQYQRPGPAGPRGHWSPSYGSRQAG